jgi:hypothetical protein
MGEMIEIDEEGAILRRASHGAGPRRRGKRTLQGEQVARRRYRPFQVPDTGAVTPIQHFVTAKLG